MTFLDDSSISALRHNEEIHRNRESWTRRPLLRRIYTDFYREIRERLAPVDDAVLELGSGMGNIKDVIPRCITTDIFENPWIDRQENAYRMSFADKTVGNLILVDVWHHLQYPGTALREFERVLKPGGRVIIFDPAMSALGRFVYGFFHHEPLGLKAPIQWSAPESFQPETAPYYSAQGNASRMFVKSSIHQHLRGWKIVEVTQTAAITYIASGGFSKPQLYPTCLYAFGRKIDRWLSEWPRIFATRLLVVLERSS